MPPPNDADRERVLWCGNLHDNVTEEILYELFLQAGPLESVKINQSKERGGKSYAFITFKHAVSVSFTVQLMSGIRLYGVALQLKARNLSTPGNSAPATPITPIVLSNNNNGTPFPSPHPLSRVLSYPNSPAAGYPDNRVAPLQRWNSESDGNNPLRADQFGYGSTISRQDARSLTPQTKASSSRNGSNWNASSGGGGGRYSDQTSGGGRDQRLGGGNRDETEAFVSQQLQLIRQSPLLMQQQQFKQSPQLQQVFRDSPQQQRHSPQPYGESPHRSSQDMYSGGRQSNSGGNGGGSGGSWSSQQQNRGYHPYAGSNSGREQYHRRR